MKTFESKYILKVAATPIGNLNEVTYRLIDAFNTADIVLCEDTRVTSNLLQLIAIDNKPKLVKFEKFTENDMVNTVIEWIKSNKQVLLVSDAGYPLISDPGYTLVKACGKNEIAVEVINGPSSITHALVASGFQTNNFMFLGFLGKTRQERTNYLSKYKDIETTFVILESVHRIQDTLKDLKQILGNQNIVIARELTKKHEEIIRTNLDSILNQEIHLKGEFVIVLENKPEIKQKDLSSLNDEILEMLNSNYKTKEISVVIGQKYNLDQKEIYNLVLKIKNEK